MLNLGKQQCAACRRPAVTPYVSVCLCFYYGTLNIFSASAKAFLESVVPPTLTLERKVGSMLHMCPAATDPTPKVLGLRGDMPSMQPVGHAVHRHGACGSSAQQQRET